MTSNRQPRFHSKTRLLVKVTIAHSFLVLFVFTVFQFQSCRQPEERVIKAKLVTAPAVQLPDVIPKDIPPTANVPSPKPVPRTPKKLPAKKPPLTYRTPDQIRKSGLTSTTPTSVPPRDRVEYKKVDSQALRAKVNAEVEALTVGAQASADWEATYLDSIVSQIYNSWVQPTRSEVKLANPVVRVEVKIDRSGKIISKSILNQTSSSAMDASVRRLLSELDRFPPFPAESKQSTLTQILLLKLTD